MGLLTIRQQCKGCPWRVCNDPRAIPNGLKQDASELLQKWSWDPGGMDFIHPIEAGMSCHESPIGPDALPCVGWAAYQLGEGNNIVLRLQARTDPNLQNLETLGEQRSMDEMLEAVGEG